MGDPNLHKLRPGLGVARLPVKTGGRHPGMEMDMVKTLLPEMVFHLAQDPASESTAGEFRSDRHLPDPGFPRAERNGDRRGEQPTLGIKKPEVPLALF